MIVIGRLLCATGVLLSQVVSELTLYDRRRGAELRHVEAVHAGGIAAGDLRLFVGRHPIASAAGLPQLKSIIVRSAASGPWAANRPRVLHPTPRNRTAGIVPYWQGCWIP